MNRALLLVVLLLLVAVIPALFDHDDHQQLGSGSRVAETVPHIPAPSPSEHRMVALSFELARATRPIRARAATRPRPKRLVSGFSWDLLAACESHGNWSIHTGNGYSGGLQMDAAFWRSYGGLAYAPAPWQASKAQQIAVAERGRAARGFSPWPTCARKLGLL